MAEDNYSLLAKPMVIRLSELACSLQIINDSYQLIEKGKSYQFIPIYGQLRSILTEKSKNQKPLLFEIADLFHEKLDLFYVPFEDLPDNLPKADFHFISPEISCEKIDKNQIPISLKNFLTEEIILLNSRKYKVDYVINALANKFCGSHYASKIEKEIAQLFYLTVFNQNILNQVIFQIGKVVLTLGTKVVQKNNCLSCYYSLYIPNQTLEDQQFIFDYYSKVYDLRYSLILNKDRTLLINIVDLNKNVWAFASEKPIAFDSFLNLEVDLGFTKDLKSAIRLKINEDTIIDKQLDYFIPISNEMHLFDCFYNRSFNNEQNGLDFFMFEIIIRTTFPDNEESKKILTYLKSKNSITVKGIFFTKGSFGITTTGDKNMKIQGTVMHKSINETNNGS